MIRLKGGKRKTVKTFLKNYRQEIKPEQKSIDMHFIFKEAIKQVISKQTFSLDILVHEEKNKESCVSEALAKAHNWLEKQFHYSSSAITYQEHSPAQPHYIRDKKKSEHLWPNSKKPNLHSPVVRNEIIAQTAATTEQVNARQQDDYGKTVVTRTLSLEEKESTYWWRITHKALKEFLYATADKTIWN